MTDPANASDRDDTSPATPRLGTRSLNPANARRFEAFVTASATGELGDCVVADAVGFEPVSAP